MQRVTLVFTTTQDPPGVGWVRVGANGVAEVSGEGMEWLNDFMVWDPASDRPVGIDDGQAFVDALPYGFVNSTMAWAITVSADEAHATVEAELRRLGGRGPGARPLPEI